MIIEAAIEAGHGVLGGPTVRFQLPLRHLLQAIVLKALCSYCVATDIIMLAMWIVRVCLTVPRASGKPLKAGPGSKA